VEQVVQKQIKDKSNLEVKSYVDTIKLTETGWKQRYYAEKFHVKGISETREFCKNIRQAYIEGLQWVFAYYYNGCTSWTWFYPYHYAPFASDLMGCDRLTITFDKGEPAVPFE
jgi:5'-3' exoribonuclease 2